MTTIGLMLPHFGDLATRERIIGTAPWLESAGVGSLWVRDNLAFQPHAFDPGGTQFFEPFTTLSAVAAVTEKLVLGTAVVIPFRHPLVTSQLYGGISGIAGPGRVIVGLGAGAYSQPFDATGGSFANRFKALEETAQVIRKTRQGRPASHDGELFAFEEVTINPPPGPDAPIWIGGSTPAAVRRARDLGDGWLPGRCPFRAFDSLRESILGGPGTAADFGTGIMPVVSIGTSREDALAAIDVPGLLHEARARKFWDGPFEGPKDLDGILIAGSPEECVSQIGQFVDRGIHQVVLDFRLRDDFDAQLLLFVDEVLPAVLELTR